MTGKQANLLITLYSDNQNSSFTSAAVANDSTKKKNKQPKNRIFNENRGCFHFSFCKWVWSWDEYWLQRHSPVSFDLFLSRDCQLDERRPELAEGFKAKQVGDSSTGASEAHPVKQNNPLPVLWSLGGAFGWSSVWTGPSRAGTRRGLPEATQHMRARNLSTQAYWHIHAHVHSHSLWTSIAYPWWQWYQEPMEGSTDALAKGN